MRIATWNVNSLRVRLPHVLDWIKQNQPDVFGLQEIKMVDDDYPFQAFEEIGYRSISNGQKTYNGVALIYRETLEATDIQTALPNIADPQKRVLSAVFDGIRVINVYVPNGQTVDSEKYTYKLDWLAALRDSLDETLTHNPNIVVMGDFNIAPEDGDVYDPEHWRDKILCSKPERQALESLFELGFVDTFRLFDQEPKSFSWWDYRALAFRRNRGLRIDLILASQALVPRCQQVTIDKTPRALERPSDHTPIIADFSPNFLDNS